MRWPSGRAVPPWLPLPLLLALAPPPAAAAPDWLAQAQALERRADWSGLLAWGQKWTEAEADNALAWFVLGRALALRGRHQEAIAAYRENLRLDPGDWYAHNNLGNVYRATQRRREALDAYRAAVRAQPDYIPAWHNLGVTFYDLKGPAGVAEALRRLHATDPGLAEAWRGLAIDYSLSRDPRVALAAIRILRRLSDAERERMFAILLTPP